MNTEQLDKYFRNDFIELYPQQKSIIAETLVKQCFLILGEQGCGKTIITVYLIKIWFLLGLIKKVFILTKNEALHKYKSEILKHVPGLEEKDVYVMPNNQERAIFDKEARIYICDYNQVKLVYENYAGKLPPKRERKMTFIKEVFPVDKDWAVVFDEIQQLKGIKSDVHKIVYKNTTKALSKVATSGTPIEKIEELYAVFKLLDERIIGLNYHFFMNKIGVLKGDTYQILKYKEDGEAYVRKRIDPYMMTLEKREIKAMVEKSVTDIEVDFNTVFKEQYNEYINELQRAVLVKNRWKRKEIATLIHPIYDKVKELSRNNPRFQKFDTLIRRFIPTEKIIVWERSPRIMNELSEYYTNQGIPNLVIHGEIDKYERTQIIKDFDNLQKYRILFISFLTSAEAWEIPSRQDCKRMIYYSLPDRAIHYKQSSDRLHRLNSKEPVFIYRMILLNSIDEWARELLDYKSKVIKGFISDRDFKQIEIDSYERFLGIDKKRIA